MSATTNPIPENRIGSGEFDETMKDFESTFAKEIRGRRDREAREHWKRGHYYQDGEMNAAFVGFLHGIAYARSIVNLHID